MKGIFQPWETLLDQSPSTRSCPGAPRLHLFRGKLRQERSTCVQVMGNFSKGVCACMCVCVAKCRQEGHTVVKAGAPGSEGYVGLHSRHTVWAPEAWQTDLGKKERRPGKKKKSQGKCARAAPVTPRGLTGGAAQPGHISRFGSSPWRICASPLTAHRMLSWDV